METPETPETPEERDETGDDLRGQLDPLEQWWLVARDEAEATEIEGLMAKVPDVKLQALWGRAPTPSSQTSEGLPPDLAKLLRGDV